MPNPEPPDNEELTRRAFALHEKLLAWLEVEAKDDHAMAVVTALTYEIGRRVGSLSGPLSNVELDRMLDAVKWQMREHVQAYRKGLRR